MKRRIALGLGAVMAMSAAPAALMAQVCPTGGQITNQSAGVCVTVDVKPNVSVWAGGSTQVTLEMDGFDGNNSAVAVRSINHINNVDADISVDVDGTFPAPIPGSGPSDGIRFYIFWNTNDTTAVRSAINNIGAPSAPGTPFAQVNGGRVWNGANSSGGGLMATVPVSGTASNIPVTYASAAPGELSNVGDFDLDVVYTIAPN